MQYLELLRKELHQRELKVARARRRARRMQEREDLWARKVKYLSQRGYDSTFHLIREMKGKRDQPSTLDPFLILGLDHFSSYSPQLSQDQMAPPESGLLSIS